MYNLVKQIKVFMSKNILIVDDQEDIRTLLAESFRGENYKVFLAEDGQKALDIYNKNTVDIILSDIKMPNLDGIEFSKKVKNININTPIFLITAFSEYTEKDIISIGAEAIIFKPFDISEIIELVNNRLKDHECEV